VAIKQRCLNPNHARYRDWGGRGITVCQRWRDSFEAFLADVGFRPGKGYSIERISNDKGYEPGNVKWATAAEQQRNTRRNRFYMINGERLCLEDVARRHGVGASMLRGRLDKGMSLEDALTTPIGLANPQLRLITYNGTTRSLSDWARFLNMHTSSLHQRLETGWSIEAAITIKPGESRRKTAEERKTSQRNWRLKNRDKVLAMKRAAYLRRKAQMAHQATSQHTGQAG
jgi:hypothetical protein